MIDLNHPAILELLEMFRDEESPYHQDLWDSVPWVMYPSLNEALGTKKVP